MLKELYKKRDIALPQFLTNPQSIDTVKELTHPLIFHSNMERLKVYLENHLSSFKDYTVFHIIEYIKYCQVVCPRFQ